MAAASASATLWKEKERNKGSILWRKCDFILIKDSRWKWISFGCGGVACKRDERRRGGGSQGVIPVEMEG